MRFQTGHSPEVERMRIRLGRGIVGQAAVQRRSILIEDVRNPDGGFVDNYIDANPGVRSELAVPLIVKNKVIGVIDIQSETPPFSPPSTSACWSSSPPAWPSPSRTHGCTRASPARPRP